MGGRGGGGGQGEPALLDATVGTVYSVDCNVPIVLFLLCFPILPAIALGLETVCVCVTECLCTYYAGVCIICYCTVLYFIATAQYCIV